MSGMASVTLLSVRGDRLPKPKSYQNTIDKSYDNRGSSLPYPDFEQKKIIVRKTVQ